MASIQPTAIILFDGVCNLCAKSVQEVISHDPNGYFHFASMQSPTGQALLQQNGIVENDLKSFVLIENGIAYTKSTAALMVAKKLTGAYKLLSPFIVLPRFIRDGVYNFIANNRYKWFGKKEACWLPTPAIRKRFID